MGQREGICHVCKEPFFWDEQCENVMCDRCGKPTCVKCEYNDDAFLKMPAQVCVECYGRMEE